MSNQKPQQDLLPPEEIGAAVFFDKLESTTGDYTAERLRQKRPEDYKVIVAMLARGYGVQKIEDEFHKLNKQLSKNTVRAVRKAEGQTIDLLREQLAGDLYAAADQFQEAAVIIVSEIMANKFRREKLTVRDAQSLMVNAGIATTNAQLLAGQPTARVDLRELQAPSHDDFNALLKKLPALNVESVTTHLTAETPAQKDGAATSGAGSPRPAPGEPGKPVSSNSESAAREQESQ